uniref:Ig-like domain-containing protein n=1 Tax=Salarias fasciatus TaxID=181472 RepID=A0A672IYR1_SALFA
MEELGSLRLLSLFLALELLCNGTQSRAPPECPIEITPETLIVEYQNQGRPATCQPTSTSASHVRQIYWQDLQDNRTFDVIDWLPDTYNNWYSRPACFGDFQGIGTCHKKLKVIIYKTPDSVSIRPLENSSSVLEDRAFQLHCDIINVAPAQMLTVQWYRGSEAIGPGVLSLEDCQPDDVRNCDIGVVKSPVNLTSSVNVTLNRAHSGAEFRCEAQLRLGSEASHGAWSSESAPLNLTVLYKPVINTAKLPKRVPLFRGYPEELVCEAHGSPAPVIQWLYSKDKVVQVSGGNLTVFEEGIYNCSARNGVDSTVHVVEVVLKEDYLPLIAGFVAVTVVVISVIFVFLYSIYYKNTKMRRYSLKNPKLSTHNGNVATNGWDLPLPMTKLS